MKNILNICSIVLAVIALQGCLGKEDSLTEKSTAPNDDRKVDLLRWKRTIDTDYKNCIFVPGNEVRCKKEFDEAMVPFVKAQAKGN